MSNNDGQYNPITRIASVCCPHTGHTHGTAEGERSTALTFSTTNKGTFSEAMRISQKGFVGIGTHSPDAPLHVDTYASDIANGTLVRSYIRYWDNASLRGPSSDWTGEYGRISIHTSRGIWAQDGYVMSSDSRIKTDISNINDDRALQQVNALESKEYHYIDPERKHPMKTIGFIAQDVKNIIPNAVSLQKSFIPDEMRMLTDPQWDTLILTIPDLDMSPENLTGMCKFYVSNDQSGNDEVCREINCEKDVNGNNTNRFKFEQKYANVFFYGKEVNDFHTLDKNQIFALHHSAIQELSRRNDAKTEKIVALEAKNTALEAKNAALEARLAALEAKVDALLVSSQ